MKGPCSVDDCQRPAWCKGLCNTHDSRMRRNGHLELIKVERPSPHDRFWSKVQKTETCWLWTGAMAWGLYGSFNIGGTGRYAHRVAYEWLVGPIPDGLELDHLCRVQRCVNPGHLEPVTHSENSLRSPVNRPSHCPQGHAYTEANTGIYGDRRKKRCRTCSRERMRLARASKKASA